jgi:hypothetical protein
LVEQLLHVPLLPHQGLPPYKRGELFYRGFNELATPEERRKSPFVAIHVTNRNAPKVTACMISEPKL